LSTEPSEKRTDDVMSANVSGVTGGVSRKED
jgi:hypothetical protein